MPRRPFKWSWHQLTPHPARLLETKAACLSDCVRIPPLFGAASNACWISSTSSEICLLITRYRPANLPPTSSVRMPRHRSPLIVILSCGEHNRPGLGAVKAKHLRDFRTREYASVLPLCLTSQIAHDRCERRKGVGKLLVQLKIEFLVGISPFQIVADGITSNGEVAAIEGYLRECGASRGSEYRLSERHATGCQGDETKANVQSNAIHLLAFTRCLPRGKRRVTST